MMSHDDVDVDAILSELGQFGRYQVFTYSVILLPIVFGALYNSQYIFNAASVDYRCLVPECESSPPRYDNSSWAVWAYPEGGGSCERLQSVGEGCDASTFHLNKTVVCSSWLYKNNYSIVTEFNLACEDWKRTLVGTVHSIGLFAALPLTAFISDLYGRRTAFILTSVCAGIAGLLRSLSTSYTMYLILEFIEPTFGSGVYSTGFILALEMVGQDRRVLGGNILSSSFAMGEVLLACIAWAVPYWRDLTRVIYAPSLLFVFYCFTVEESVRWLLSNGKKNEAARIIFKAAAINNKKLSPDSIRQLTEDNRNTSEKKSHDVQNPTENAKTPSLFIEVLKSRIIMSRLCVCCFWWITATFIYYGLSINSVSLAGNKYVNYMLTSLVEIPGYCLSVLTLDRFGRKRTILTSFFVCGISLTILPFIPHAFMGFIISLTLLGKMTISLTFSSIYIYTSELFPTSARHMLLGTSSMVGRVGSILAPLTPLLMNYMVSLPYLIFGLMAACSGALTLLTPETLRMRLPDTVHQAENISGQPRGNDGNVTVS